MVTNIKAIPTAYGGVRFRSRLEARWAAFFDICHWHWTYEPQDFDGYIPDFLLSFRVPMLVEVKPVQWDESELDEKILEDARIKIARSGIAGEVLLLGSRIVKTSAHQRLGAILDVDHDQGVSPWDSAFAFRCDYCGARSVAAENLSWHCRVKGCYGGRDHLDAWDADRDFRTAGSEVQWVPK